jgi:hypothetical protein
MRELAKSPVFSYFAMSHDAPERRMIFRRSLDDPRLIEAVSRLVDDLQPAAIILFGSRARANARADSDYDLLVVSAEPRDYDEVYRPIAGRGLRCDVVPCSVAGWKEASEHSAGVLRAARKDGLLLYGQF